jgi:hypothetical protein
MKFPRELNKSIGWKIDYGFLEDIKAIVEKKSSDYGPRLDVIEDVLLAVEYLTNEDQDDGR